MNPPIYVYYRLTNFYQNHRRFVSSLSQSQLSGQNVTSYTAIASCSPIESVNGSQVASQFYYPCGLVANSLFNDSFSLSSNTSNVFIDETGIAWSSDINNKFKNCQDPNGCAGYTILPSGINVTALNGGFTNEHFVVWFRIAALSDFKKLWGRITTPITAGNYTLNIANSYFPFPSLLFSFSPHKQV